MMGRRVAQGSLLYSFRLEDHVPADHLMRRIDGLLNFAFLHKALAETYNALEKTVDRSRADAPHAAGWLPSDGQLIAKPSSSKGRIADLGFKSVDLPPRHRTHGPGTVYNILVALFRC